MCIRDSPLPPYLKKTPSERDQARYQTVYAKVDGAVAAPTAGLHFDDNILKEIGLGDSISSQRTNGFGAAIHKIQNELVV